MSKVYIQMSFPNTTFAKTITEDSKPGGILDGYSLVCIHPHIYHHHGEVTEYIATFVRDEKD